MLEEEQEPFISIVILSKDRHKDIVRCLESIAKLRYKNIEVIIIDNHSTSQENLKLPEKFPEHTYIYLNDNLGTSVTRNAGAALASGEYIWFLDNDTEITKPDYITQILALFAVDDKLGAIGGEAILGEGNKVESVKELDLQQNGFTDGRINHGNYGELSYVKCLATCNVFIKREAFDHVGGFDPWFFFYLEDLDLTFRIYQSDYKLAVLCKTPVIHWFSSGGRGSPWLGPNKNRIYFVVKNFPWPNILVLPILDFFYLVRPSNFTRLVSYSRKADLGSEAFLRDSTNLKRGLTIEKIRRGLLEAIKFPLTILLGYISVLPHISKGILSRSRPSNYVTTSCLRGKIKKLHPPGLRDYLNI